MALKACGFLPKTIPPAACRLKSTSMEFLSLSGPLPESLESSCEREFSRQIFSQSKVRANLENHDRHFSTVHGVASIDATRQFRALLIPRPLSQGLCSQDHKDLPSLQHRKGQVAPSG
jgi:hypothetical protein